MRKRLFWKDLDEPQQWFVFQHLRRIDLDITGLCNRTCSFCPRVDDLIYPNVNKHMSLELIKTLAQDMIDMQWHGILELAGRGESTQHPEWKEIVDYLHSVPNKTWKLRLTTNGVKIEEWWDEIAPKLDGMILNSYDSEEEYNERRVKYRTLPNGVLIEQIWKPDGLTIEEINQLDISDNDTLAQPFAPTEKSPGKFRMSFNNRAGFFKTPVTLKLEEARKDGSCRHPVRQMFINYEGNYQMCCNDWNNQITIGSAHENNIFDMYLTNPKMKRIQDLTLTGRRDEILPCKKCDIKQNASASVKEKVRTTLNDERYAYFSELIEEGKAYDLFLAVGK